MGDPVTTVNATATATNSTATPDAAAPPAMEILMYGDMPGGGTGFGKVLDNLGRRWAEWGAVVDVWAVGYPGAGYGAPRPGWVREMFGTSNPHWATAAGYTAFMQHLMRGNYTHVWICADHFQLAGSTFWPELAKVCQNRGIRSVFYFPVDAPVERAWLSFFDHVGHTVTYTDWGLREVYEAVGARAAARLQVAGHGVDPAVYAPMAAGPERLALRRALYPGGWLRNDDFVILVVNAHQRRKDMMRALELVRALVSEARIPAKLIFHCANKSTDRSETTLTGVTDLRGVAEQLGLTCGREFQVNAMGTLPESTMAQLYGAADLVLSTSLGEGWGLAQVEALACGTAIASPAHTACLEIMHRARQYGLARRVVALPIEAGGVVLPNDNSRVRYRVELAKGWRAIADYYQSGEWRERPALTPVMAMYLDWERLASQFWAIFTGGKNAGRYAWVAGPVDNSLVDAIWEAEQAATQAAPPSAEPTPTPTAAAPTPEPVAVAVAGTGTGGAPAPVRLVPVDVRGSEPVVAETQPPAIPVLAVPILNRGDLLWRLFQSIDHPVAVMHVWVNTDPARHGPPPDPGVVQVLNDMERAIQGGQSPVRKLVATLAEKSVAGRAKLTNHGVAGSWNRLVWSNSKAPWWLISGNDMQLMPGDLAKIAAEADQVWRDNVRGGRMGGVYGMLYANSANLFVLTQAGRDLVGPWDENLWPAYLEDCDWAYRADLLGVGRRNIEGIQAIHGEPDADGKVTGSCTIRSDAEVGRWNGITHANNFIYYKAKWGGSNGEEKFARPFNLPKWRVDAVQDFTEWRSAQRQYPPVPLQQWESVPLAEWQRMAIQHQVGANLAATAAAGEGKAADA